MKVQNHHKMRNEGIIFLNYSVSDNVYVYHHLLNVTSAPYSIIEKMSKKSEILEHVRRVSFGPNFD